MPQMTPVQRRVWSLVFSQYSPCLGSEFLLNTNCGGDNEIMYDGHFARCKLQKINGVGAFYLSRYDRFMVMDLWSLWCRCRMVYGAGQCAALGANCKSNLLIGDLHYCRWLCLGAGLQLDLSPSLLQHFAALHRTAGHLLCLSSLSSRKKTIFWNILWNMSGPV